MMVLLLRCRVLIGNLSAAALPLFSSQTPNISLLISYVMSWSAIPKQMSWLASVTMAVLSLRSPSVTGRGCSNSYIPQCESTITNKTSNSVVLICSPLMRSTWVDERNEKIYHETLENIVPKIETKAEVCLLGMVARHKVLSHIQALPQCAGGLLLGTAPNLSKCFGVSSSAFHSD